MAKSIIRRNAENDPNYAPYCGRCSGLVRMRKTETPFVWQCKCGAVHDETTHELRLLDSVREYNVLQLPVATTGSFPELTEYAKQNGYTWKPAPRMLFGGYFAHIDGNCLFVT